MVQAKLQCELEEEVLSVKAVSELKQAENINLNEVIKFLFEVQKFKKYKLQTYGQYGVDTLLKAENYLTEIQRKCFRFILILEINFTKDRRIK